MEHSVDLFEPFAFRDLALALAIGLLIGMERGWTTRTAPPGSRIAGLRTFGLLGAMGGVSGMLALNPGLAWISAALGLGVVVILALGYARSSQSERTISATTAIAGLLTTALGALAVSGYPVVAGAMAVAVALLLSLRTELHGWLSHLSAQEFASILRFLLLAVVILPLLSNRDMGPYQAFNPFDMGLAIVLLSFLSFAGYWASKYFGVHMGVVLTAALGGVVSSTAVTLALARRSQEDAYQPSLIAAGILVGSVVMLIRVCILSAIVAPLLTPYLLPPLVGAIMAGLLVTALFWHGLAQAAPLEQTSRNPLELRTALAFVTVLGAVMVGSRWTLQHYGNSGLFAVSAITAIIDVDAVTLSIGKLTNTEALPLLSHALLLAVAINTIVKAAIALIVAEKRAGCLTVAGFAFLLTVGGACHFWVP